jgi:hypothetical protein
MAFFKGRYSNLFELLRTRYIDTASEDENSYYNKVWYDPMQAEGCRWKHLSEDGKNFLDVEIEFIKGEIESDGVRNCLIAMSQDENAKLTIAVCLTYTHQAVAASLYMPMAVYENARLQQIWVYQQEAADIVLNLNNAGNDLRYSKLKPFGMLYGEYMSDRTLYLKAMLVNVAYDITNNYNDIGWPQDISDRKDANAKKARKSWRKLSVDKKWSNKYFADSISIKVRNILMGEVDFSRGYKMKQLFENNSPRAEKMLGEALANNADSLARCEHNRWNIQQLVLGYSPCDEEVDQIFELRDKLGKEDVSVKQEYIRWKERTVGVKTEIDKINDIKDDVKECKLRLHPNLCDYAHLDKVDSGAKKYDKDLNNAILKIISIVDGNKRSTCYE